MSLALPEGTEIGGYVLADVLGRGGFGITYRARKRSTQQVFAIKEFLPEDFAQRDPRGTVSARPGRCDTYARGLAGFIAEANTLKKLPRREGLVKVSAAFERSGTAYCVMEYIEGDSLDRMVARMTRRLGHIPPALVADLAAAMCWALDALHEEGLIHRDVKPANIMIRRSGAPVLIDFGAARELSTRRQMDAMYTPRYAAIEQFPVEETGFGRGFAEGPWSDVYSLSAVLYELVTAKPPPDAKTRAQAMLSAQADPYLPTRQALSGSGREADYEPGLLDAIDAGCALMPGARPRSVRDFSDRFRALPAPVAAEGRAGLNPSREAQPVPEEETLDGARRSAALLALLALAGAGLVGAYFVMPEVFR